MKTGRSLSDLAAEIERQRETKRDFVTTTAAMQMVAQPNGVSLAMPGDLGFGVNSVAHDQIGLHTGIPSKYYDRMLAEAPDLLANNVNRWFSKYPAERMVRTLDGHVRAFLSESYRPLENADLAEAVLPILLDLRVQIMSCEITERRLYIKAVDERIQKDVPTGKKMGDGHTFFDTCSPAIVISNSEVGFGALRIDTGVWTRLCTNLAVVQEAGMKRRHVGAKTSLAEGEEIRHLLSDATKEATDRAIWMQVRDIVKGAFDEARFQALAMKMGKLSERPIEGDLVKVVELSAKRFGATEGERSSILKHLAEGGDLSQYGLFNAFTRTAQDIESYDRATEFERMGGEVLELPADEWRTLNKQAAIA